MHAAYADTNTRALQPAGGVLQWRRVLYNLFRSAWLYGLLLLPPRCQLRASSTAARPSQQPHEQQSSRDRLHRPQIRPSNEQRGDARRRVAAILASFHARPQLHTHTCFRLDTLLKNTHTPSRFVHRCRPPLHTHFAHPKIRLVVSCGRADPAPLRDIGRVAPAGWSSHCMVRGNGSFAASAYGIDRPAGLSVFAVCGRHREGPKRLRFSKSRASNAASCDGSSVGYGAVSRGVCTLAGPTFSCSSEMSNRSRW